MPDTLPLRIKMQLRDLWENRESPAQKAIRDLEAVLGLPVRVNLQVPLLWHDLSQFHTSPDTFVPSVIGIIQSWAETLELLLDNEDHTAWADQLLSRLDGVLEAVVFPAGTTDSPSAILYHDASGIRFHILIPPAKPSTSGLAADFADAFSTLFENVVIGGPIPSLTDNPTTTTPSELLPQSQPQISSSKTQQQSQRPKQSSLPSLATLPRPEILLAETPPYHILVEVLSDKIKIMGSHEASLNLLCGYLKKWMRNAKDMAPSTPTLKIEFKESNFGYGVLRDCILLERTNPLHKFVELNPAIILAFVESVLGYNLVEGGIASGRWHFRREEKFARR